MNEPVLLTVRVESTTRKALARAAQAAEMSSSALFDRLVDEMPLDSEGRCAWLTYDDKDKLPIE